MSGQHTKGPWRVEQDTTLIWGACNPNDASNYGMGYPIAEARITPINSRWAAGPDPDTGEANARLIAAAPEMFEALETVMQWVKAWDVGFLFDDEWPADEAKINAAIAKARGQ